MPAIKKRMTEVIRSQPEDATYVEILRGLASERMIERGLADVQSERTVSDEEAQRRIQTWGR